MHFPLSVLEGEGVALSEEYGVGNSYPVFILTNAKGQVITRWTGYTGADRFIQMFDQAKTDLTTVEARARRYDATPSVRDGSVLAKYYTETGEHMISREYYRRLQETQGNTSDYSYQIFKATAEAVWNSQLPFDSLTTEADNVLSKPKENQKNLGQLAQIMSNVSRRTGNTDKIANYLDAGARATRSRTDEAGISTNRDIVADYALYVLKDTTQALNIKKTGLGKDWLRDPAKYYQYGDFCFQRKIDLSEAERLVRLATNKASEGKFKAKHLRLLAEILHALGKTDEAILTGRQALDQDPTTSYFEETLNQWLSN